MVLASAMSRAHISPAFSSNERTRLANRACGPSGPANQALSASRFRPFGFFKNAAMDFSDSQRGDKEILIFLLPIQVSSDLDCSGLMTLSMMLVSRR